MADFYPEFCNSALNRPRRRGTHLHRTRKGGFMIETLERRRLLSFTVSGGILTVNGTAGADHISITRDGTNLTIHQNGVNSTTPAAAVQKIVINGLAGNDELRLALGLDHGVRLPSTLNGGGGNDRLFGGGRDNCLHRNGGDARVLTRAADGAGYSTDGGA